MSVASSSAIATVSATRAALGVIAVLRALLWAMCVGLALWLAGRLVQGALSRIALNAEPGWSTALCASGAVATFCTVLWRERFAWSLNRTALWLEERLPPLQYALVTLIDPFHAQTAVRTQLEAVVAGVRVPPIIVAAARDALLRPMAVLAIAVLALAAFSLMPSHWSESLLQRASRIDPLTTSRSTPQVNRLLNLTAELTPPAYTGWPRTSLSDPATIKGLIGTQVQLSGSGGPDGLAAQLGDQLAAVTESADGRWTVSFILPPLPMALTLTDRHYRRVVVLESRADEAPLVTLRAPASDQVLKTLPGMLVLEADVKDDVAVSRAYFEYIVASGESEGNYVFRSGVLSQQRFERNAVTGKLASRTPFAFFKLQAGDQLSVRAVAFDANTLSGPGKGYSETRVIRIARENETVKAGVTPAPPSTDNSAMSLRMLIRATEKLEARRASLDRNSFVVEAQSLAGQAVVIRGKVQGLIDAQSVEGAFDVSPLLTTALQAMWEGSRALEVAETAEALPPLRRANEALKELRDSAKYYFRGQASNTLVDIDSVRMSGTEPVAATKRSARAVSDRVGERLAIHYAEAIALLNSDPTRAIEQLTLLRVEALQARPALASALDQALAALREGRDTTEAFLRARRALEGAAVHAEAGAWSPL